MSRFRSQSSRSISVTEVEVQRRSIPRSQTVAPETIVPTAEDLQPPVQPISNTVCESFISVHNYDDKVSRKSRSSEATASSERAQSVREHSSNRVTLIPTIAEVKLQNILADVAYYRQRYRDAEKERQFFEKELRQKESIFAKTKGIPIEIQREIEKKNNKISALEEQLNNRDWLQPYLTIGKVNWPPVHAGRLRSAFLDMQSQFSSLPIIRGLRLLSVAVLHDLSFEANDLLKSIYGNTWVTERDVLSSLPTGKLVQALTGAAVCDWVFREEFHCTLLSSTPLLQKYREHINTVCGDDALSNLDAAAHQSLMEEDCFKSSVIPTMASKHAERLVNALSALIKDRKRPRTSAKLKECFHDIFVKAIEVRSLALICTEHHNIWPLVSDDFDQSIMETDPENPVHASCKVKLPLVPGLSANATSRQRVVSNGSGGLEASPKIRGLIIRSRVLV